MTAIRRGGVVSRWGQPVIALGVAVIALGIPFWLIVVTAGKSRAQALNPDMSLPTSWHLFQNITAALAQGSMIAAFIGSVVILVPSVILVLLLGSFASWILARRSGRTIAVLYAVSISGIILPPAIVTLVLVLKEIGLAGNVVGMIGVYVGMYSSTVIFFITGFVRTIPVELEEAARMDGANPFTVFIRVIFPLLRPTLATATILICLYVWNDVFYALFIIGGRVNTLPLNLYQVASSGLYLNNWNLIFAYVIMMTLPLLVTFILAQRRIISGITSGAVK